jgi:hypothetical protein
MKRFPTQFSNSEISTYEQCKLKYQLQYLSDTESTFDTVEAFMGNRVHDSLEKLYLDIQMTRVLSLDELISFYDEIWDKHWNDAIYIVKKNILRKITRKKELNST